MQIIDVNNSRTAKEFLLLPVLLYKNEKNWVRPLNKDIEDVFDPQRNKLFRNGACTRWILLDENNNTIGRVAAFINNKTAKSYDQPTGGIGFFECINNRDAAFKLFDTCKTWLEEHSMEAMDGPINFGDRDRWWGLLTDGFDREPNYGMGWHFPYYKELFEAYGFKEYYKQFTFARDVDTLLPQKTIEKANRLKQDPNYSFESFRKKDLQKFAEDFCSIYNKAWAKHTGVKPMRLAQAVAMMKKMKPVVDEKIIFFAYYNKEPIGFYINLPELNQIFKYVNGKLNLIGKLIFLWHKLLKTNKKIFGVVFGVTPEFQGKGVESALITAMRDTIQGKGQYTYYEMNWIGDFNPKMIKMVEELVGGFISKTHITYRKLFDETKPFIRMPMMK